MSFTKRTNVFMSVLGFKILFMVHDFANVVMWITFVFLCHTELDCLNHLRGDPVSRRNLKLAWILNQVQDETKAGFGKAKSCFCYSHYSYISINSYICMFNSLSVPPGISQALLLPLHRVHGHR